MKTNSPRSPIRPTFRPSTVFRVAVTRRDLLAGSGAAAVALALGGIRPGDRAGAKAMRQDGDFEVSAEATDVILQVTVEGGFVPAQTTLLQMPTFSLFGDGLVVTQGPVTMQFPGAALPNLRATRLSPEGIQAVLTEADRAGLLAEDLFLRIDQIADAGTTVFTTTASGRTVVVSAYALGPEVPLGVTGSVAEIYARLAEFQTMLATLTDWLPEGSILEADAAYPVDRLQIVAIPVANLISPLDPAGGEADWPLDPGLSEYGLPFGETDSEQGSLPEFGEARCAVFAGDDAATLVAALAAGNSQTEWASDGAAYALFPRPLLPNESGCGDPIDAATPGA